MYIVLLLLVFHSGVPGGDGKEKFMKSDQIAFYRYVTSSWF